MVSSSQIILKTYVVARDTQATPVSTSSGAAPHSSSVRVEPPFYRAEKSLFWSWPLAPLLMVQWKTGPEVLRRVTPMDGSAGGQRCADLSHPPYQGRVDMSRVFDFVTGKPESPFLRKALEGVLGLNAELGTITMIEGSSDASDLRHFEGHSGWGSWLTSGFHLLRRSHPHLLGRGWAFIPASSTTCARLSVMPSCWPWWPFRTMR